MSIRIDGTNTTANPGITGSDTDTGLQFGTNEVKVVTDGSDRVTVDSSGNVGIGTTANSDSQLHVKSGANDGDPVLRLEAATNNFLNFRQTGSVYDIRVTAGDPLSFTIGSSEKARVTSDGLTFNGDTAAINALDDYEEGTYVVTLTCGTSGTITLNSGYDTMAYEKIGRMCTVHGRVRISSVSSPTGTLIISLPFARDGMSQDQGRIGGTITVQNLSANMNEYGIHPTGATGAELCRTDSTGPGLTPANNFSGDEFVYMSVTYRTAT